MNINLGLTGDLVGSFFFLVLSLLLLANWRGQLIGGLLLLASIVSTAWFTTSAWYQATGVVTGLVPFALEILRDLSWILFLYLVLRQGTDAARSWHFNRLLPLVVAIVAIFLFALIFTGSVNKDFVLAGVTGVHYLLTGFFIFSLAGLLLVEKFFRSLKPGKRWAIKYLCLGIGGLFIYDFFMYSEALLFKQINIDLFNIRGLINGICVPLIAISVARSPEWKMDLFVSRHVVYHSTATTAAGIYLILMAVIGYYLQNIGGTYGGVLQILFFFGALMLLVILLFSEQLRTELKVFIAKHFYKNKYDYREEWLKITDNLSRTGPEENIYQTILKAVTNTIRVNSAELWLLEDDEKYVLRETLGSYPLETDELPLSSAMTGFMRKKQWIIQLDEYRNNPEQYDNISLPDKILTKHDAWLIVPLINGKTLIGFIVLSRSYANISFGWEDLDLLKTIGNQVAGYLALYNATEALSEAKQFEAFNHLSAFVVHDIKNMVAQLSLINKNAKKHRDNPEFIDDALETIDNTVNKMTRLLENLRKERTFGGYTQDVDMKELVEEVIGKRSGREPVPELKTSQDRLIVNAERDSLLSVIEHLVQNAQEATDKNGKVEIALRPDHAGVAVQITDDGCGMDEDFIRNRLFKAFETTKGNAGMGIGVYESRELVHKMHGKIDVQSKPGAGTTFTVSLPRVMSE